MYSYQKNYFDPYESRDYDKRQLEDAKKQAEVARLAAETEAKKQADKIGGGAGALQLDSGLGGLGGMSGGSSIPGLGSPAPSGGSSMAIPGLDSAPSMGAPGMGAPADATMGAPAATPPKPATPLPGL